MKPEQGLSIWGTPWENHPPVSVAGSSKGLSLERLDRLIAETEKLSDRARRTLTGELNDLKNRARYCLADLGSEAQDALRKITRTEFLIPSDAALREESEERCYQNLDRLRRALETVRDKIETGQSAASSALSGTLRKPRRSRGGKQSKARLPYSKTDHALYEMIGLPNFRNLTNAQLMRCFGPKWRKAMPGRTNAAFRSSLYRIRRYHEAPAPKKLAQE